MAPTLTLRQRLRLLDITSRPFDTLIFWLMAINAMGCMLFSPHSLRPLYTVLGLTIVLLGIVAGVFYTSAPLWSLLRPLMIAAPASALIGLLAHYRGVAVPVVVYCSLFLTLWPWHLYRCSKCLRERQLRYLKALYEDGYISRRVCDELHQLIMDSYKRARYGV